MIKDSSTFNVVWNVQNRKCTASDSCRWPFHIDLIILTVESDRFYRHIVSSPSKILWSMFPKIPPLSLCFWTSSSLDLFLFFEYRSGFSLYSPSVWFLIVSLLCAFSSSELTIFVPCWHWSIYLAFSGTRYRSFRFFDCIIFIFLYTSLCLLRLFTESQLFLTSSPVVFYTCFSTLSSSQLQVFTWCSYSLRLLINFVPFQTSPCNPHLSLRLLVTDALPIFWHHFRSHVRVITIIFSSLQLQWNLCDYLDIYKYVIVVRICQLSQRISCSSHLPENSVVLSSRTSAWSSIHIHAEYVLSIFIFHFFDRAAYRHDQLLCGLNCRLFVVMRFPELSELVSLIMDESLFITPSAPMTGNNSSALTF